MAGGGGNWDDSRNKLKAVPMHHSLHSRNSTFLFLCLPGVWIYLVVLCTFQPTVFIESCFVQRTVPTVMTDIKMSMMRPPSPQILIISSGWITEPQTIIEIILNRLHVSFFSLILPQCLAEWYLNVKFQCLLIPT